MPDGIALLVVFLHPLPALLRVRTSAEPGNREIVGQILEPAELGL